MMFDNLPGRNLDRYRILRQVGENPLGPIFQAHDPNLQRDVAIQLIQPSITARPDFSDDFIRTARAAARLDHPNLVQVFDFSQSREASYLVMEFIPGDHLEGLLHEMRRSGQWILLGEAVQIVRQMAHVMEYVRVQGVPQRSVNPSAIMFKPVPNDNLPYLPVLTDLGFAGVLEWGLAENPLIDPIYLSPEGAVGRATDARSDVYVLGILLYELVTGQPPFPIESIEDAVRYHTRQPLPAPRSVRPDIPAGLEAIIVRALEKNPEARYPNPGALANELERVLPAAQEVRSAPPVLESAVSLLVPYRLSVEGRLVRPSIPPSEPSREEPPVPAAATQVAGAAGSGRQAELDIFLERNQVSLEPGSTVTLGVNLVNRSSTPGRFRLSLEGVPNTWVSINPELVQLEPEEQKNATVTIRPPRSPQSRAGRYPLILRAIGQQGVMGTAEARATLSLGVFTRFTSELLTRRVRSGENVQLTISNQGNAPETFTILTRDPAGELEFDPPQAQIRLEEGQSGMAELKPRLRTPRLVGAEASHPFRIQVASANGEMQVHTGEMTSFPLVPLWVLGVFLVSVLCVTGVVALLLTRDRLQVSQATATARAGLTALAEIPLMTAQAETATAQFLADANQATIQAVTATAEWLAADPDNDGLTNQREMEIGTLPNNPDTDNDGLNDGREVELGTDPLRPDTDGDGLTDGVEVELGTDPLNPDTDGDGIPDGRDPDPLYTSTPPPDLNATQAAALTQTAAVVQATQAAQNQTATAQALATAAQATAIAATQTAAAQPPPATDTSPPPTDSQQPGPRLLYIYLTADGEARSYQELLQDAGYQVDIIPLDAVPSTDLAPFAAIIVGPDTGSEESWGDTNRTEASRVLNSNKPVIGLGEGGFALFGIYDLFIGYDPDTVRGTLTSATSVLAVDRNSPVWNTPVQIEIPQNGIVPLYERNSQVIVVHTEGAPADVIRIGRLPEEENRFPIIAQNRFVLWGFSGPRADMSVAGEAAFTNLVDAVVP